MIDYIREHYSYDPETGQIFSKRAGRVIGSKVKNRNTFYWSATIRGRRHRLHRVAWVIHYGVWPSGQIDHMNGNGLDNRLENLRDSTHTQNQRNQRIHRKNTTGVRGVSPYTRTGQFQASIWFNGKRLYLGRFDTIEAAASARAAAEARYWAE